MPLLWGIALIINLFILKLSYWFQTLLSFHKNYNLTNYQQFQVEKITESKPCLNVKILLRIIMDEDEGIELAKDIFDTAEDLSGLSSTVGQCLESIKDKKPEIAQKLGDAAKICT